MDVSRTHVLPGQRRFGVSLAVAFSALLLLGACGGTASSGGGGDGDSVTVFGAYATQIEEPWDGVIHSALQAEADAGRITYTFTDDIGYAGDMAVSYTH